MRRQNNKAGAIRTYVSANNTADIHTYKSVNITKCYLLLSKMLNLP